MLSSALFTYAFLQTEGSKSFYIILNPLLVGSKSRKKAISGKKVLILASYLPNEEIPFFFEFE